MTMFSDFFYISLDIRIQFSIVRILGIEIDDEDCSSLRCDMESKERAFSLGFEYPTHSAPPVFKDTVLQSFFIRGQETKLSLP